MKRPVYRSKGIYLASITAFTLLSPLQSQAHDLLYGIGEDNLIYEVDAMHKTTTSVFNTNPTVGAGALANAFAFDEARDEFFFISQVNFSSTDKQKDLYFWDRGTQLTKIATRDQLGLTADVNSPANAAYYGNAFWYFIEGTNLLHKVSFTYASGVPVFDKLEKYAITLPPDTNNRFGDIDIDDKGILYAATTKLATHNSATFYSINLNELVAGAPGTGVATGIKLSSESIKPNESLQLAFSFDHKTLYGHSAITGQWYTINVATGDVTLIDGFISDLPNTVTNHGLRDIGGSADTTKGVTLPVATSDNFTTLINTPLNDSLLSNDTVPEGSALSLVGDNPTSLLTTGGGSVTLDPATGKISYTPQNGFKGTDSFEYKLCLPYPNDYVCATGKATITVEACNFNTQSHISWRYSSNDKRLSALFGDSFVLGNPSVFKYTFTNKQAVTGYLRSSGTDKIYTTSRVNPPRESNSLSAQLLTLSLNVRANKNLSLAMLKFDAQSCLQPMHDDDDDDDDDDDGYSDIRKYLADKKIVTVGDLLGRANAVTGGGTPVSKTELALLRRALEAVSLSWPNGKQSRTSVVYCPAPN